MPKSNKSYPYALHNSDSIYSSSIFYRWRRLVIVFFIHRKKWFSCRSKNFGEPSLELENLFDPRYRCTLRTPVKRDPMGSVGGCGGGGGGNIGGGGVVINLATYLYLRVYLCACFLTGKKDNNKDV